MGPRAPAAILRDAAQERGSSRMTAVYVSLRLDAGEFRDLGPFVDLRQHVSLHIIGRSAGGFGAELAQPRNAVFGLEEFVDADVEPVDDLLRRLRRRSDGEP